MAVSSKLGLVVGSGLGVGVGVMVGSGVGDGVGVGVGVGVGSSVPSAWRRLIDSLDAVVVASICFAVVAVFVSDIEEAPNKQSDAKRIVTTSKLESLILDIEDTI